MKISISSDIVSYDSNILKAEYTKIFESGIKGVDQSIPPLSDGSPLAADCFEHWTETVYSSVISAGGVVAQCHCPIITPVDFSEGHAKLVHDDIRKQAYDKIFRAAHLWNCPVVIHPITFDFFAADSLWNEYASLNIEFFSILSEYAEKYDVRIAAENLFDIKGIARHFCCEPVKLKYIVDSVNSSHLGVCIDTGHAFMTGYQPYEFLNLFKDKVYALHIHDNNGFSDQHNLPPFGNIDWNGFAKALKNIDYKGFFNYEVHGDVVMNMTNKLKAAYYKYAYQYAMDLLNC